MSEQAGLTAPTGETEETTTAEPTIEIDGEVIPISTAKELLSKGKDYTQKTMTLAEERRAIEAEKVRVARLSEIEQAWNSGSEARADIVKRLAREANLDITLPSGSSPAGVPDDWDEMTPREQRMWKERESERNETKAILEETKKLLKQTTEERELDTKSLKAMNSLREDLGVEVSAADLKAAVKETGINDPEAAWLKAHKADLAKSLQDKGKKSAVTEKPQTPGNNRAATFDPSKLSAAEIAAEMAAGKTPTEQLKRDKNKSWRDA